MGRCIPFKHKAVSLQFLNAKPGETYYFNALYDVRNGNFSLDQVDPDEGAHRVALTRFGMSRSR
jgi:hypothetical protein